MRILFVLASFELHKDGVSDYTALLAKECEGKGHAISLLAWNDTFVGSLYEESKFGDMPLLRLSATLTPKDKRALGKAFVESVSPEIISIQMVCFGFHPRGWIFGLGSALKNILPKQVLVQIMFHELWIGMASNHPWKEKIQGWIQKQALKGFWKLLSPSVVHVSNNVYYSQLSCFGLPVRYLPLPSNITLQPVGDQEGILKALALTEEERRNSFVLLFFGSIHGRWNIPVFFEKILSLVGKKKVYVLSVGNQGYGAAYWDDMVRLENEKLHFIKLGFRSDAEVSELMQFADAGVSTNARSLLGKSGTAMAMIEHGLPVIVTRDELRFPFQLKNVEEDYPHVYLVEELQESDLFTKTPPIGSRLDRIGQRFLLDLAESERRTKN